MSGISCPVSAGFPNGRGHTSSGVITGSAEASHEPLKAGLILALMKQPGLGAMLQHGEGAPAPTQHL